MVIKKQRARQPEDKEQRRQAILLAAKKEFQRLPFTSIKMTDIAKRAKLAKGTLFIYFATKEALFLSLLKEQLKEWFDLLEQNFSHKKTREHIVDFISQSINERPELTRLLALLSNVLENNVTVEQVVDFKRFLLKNMQRLSARLQNNLNLSAIASMRFIIHLYAVVVGLRQLCEHGPVAKLALQHPDLQSLIVDFGDELKVLTHALLRESQ